ncbi:MAG: metallopeptidase family protein [Anaerolineae bacterium]|nr:metallopeptidase family protein [Anaerolineae bacterium]
MDRVEFEQLVAEALETIPEALLEKVENLQVVVEDHPTPYQLRKAGIRRGTLLGLYEGVPRTVRTTNYALVPPDKITIFQEPIEMFCRTRQEIRECVARTVRHEIAHHFGLSDARLRELGAY